MKIKRTYLTILSLSVISFTSFSVISCGWLINNKDDIYEIKKDEWKERKFNYPVMPEWQDLNIVGQNEKEWTRLQEIYSKEIKNGEKQISEIEQGLKENKLDDAFQNFYQMVGGLTKVMYFWYKQIGVEIELNLWLINKNLEINKIQQIKSKNDQQIIQQIIEKNTKLNFGFYDQWKNQFQNWFVWMENQQYIKQNNSQWLKDKNNWLRVENHLMNKNIYFKTILEKIKL